MDFHEVPKDYARNNIVLVIIDCFRKRVFSIPCKKAIDAPETARLFIYYVYRVYSALDTIILDKGP